MEIDLLLAGKSKGDDASGSQVTFEPTSGGMADGSAGALEDARAALSDLKSKVRAYYNCLIQVGYFTQ